MMDWTKTHHDSFEFLRLQRVGGAAVSLTGAIDGKLVENINTALKVSGNINMVGDADLGDDRIRIVLHAEQDGEETTAVLGTFLASTPAVSRYGADATATIDLYSMLLVLDEDAIETTLTVPAGTDAAAYARSIAQAVGLSVQLTQKTPATLTNAALVFEAGTSKLDVVNHLLDYAGYSSAAVDGFGVVLMQPYVDPSVRPVVWTFDDGDNSIFIPPVTDEFDWYGTPNVVIMTATNAETTITARAENDDPASPYSIVSRGRRIVRYEQVSDVDSQSALQAKADALLASSTSNVNTGTVQHVYAPFAGGDVVRLAYAEAGIDYLMVVQSRELELVAGVPTTTKMRRFIRA